MNLTECMACHAPMVPAEPVPDGVVLGYLLCGECTERLKANGTPLTHCLPGHLAPAPAAAAPAVHCLCGRTVKSASTRMHSGEQQLCDTCASTLAENLLSKPRPGRPTLGRFGVLDRLEMLDLDLSEMATDAIDAGCKPETIKSLIVALSETHHAYQNEVRDRSRT